MCISDRCIANEEDAEQVLGIKSREKDIEAGILCEAGYEIVAKQICRIYGCKKVAITLRESYSASRNGWSGMPVSYTHLDVYKRQMIRI